jgi:hypothetical protein
MELTVLGFNSEIAPDSPDGHYLQLNHNPWAMIVAVNCYNGPLAYGDAIIGMTPFAVACLAEPREGAEPERTGRFMAIWFRNIDETPDEAKRRTKAMARAMEENPSMKALESN